jgi:integrase
MMLVFYSGRRSKNYVYRRSIADTRSPQTSALTWRFLRKHSVELTAHGLRHSTPRSCCTRAQIFPAVNARLGHSDPSITLSIYAHVIPSDRGRLALMWEDDTEDNGKPQIVMMLGNARGKAAQSAKISDLIGRGERI